MLSVKLKGLDKINKTINTLVKELPKRVEEGVKTAIKDTYEDVLMACPVNTGETRDSIKYEVINVSKGLVSGRVYTTTDIAVYLNYGTGIYAEGEGGSRAKKIPWYIHESMVDEDLSQKYGMQVFISPTTGDRFYISYGMRATHFFDNTAFNRRDANILAVQQAIQQLFKEL